MKCLLSQLIFVLFLITSVNAQLENRFMLLDRKAHQKVTLTDSVSKKHLSDGYFPVYAAEYDSLIILIDRFKNLRQDGLSRKFYSSEDFKTEHITFKIESIRRAYGDGYDINVISNGPFGQAILKIADSRNSLNENQHSINGLLSYLKSRKKEIDKGQVIVENN